MPGSRVGKPCSQGASIRRPALEQVARGELADQSGVAAFLALPIEQHDGRWPHHLVLLHQCPLRCVAGGDVGAQQHDPGQRLQDLIVAEDLFSILLQDVHQSA